MERIYFYFDSFAFYYRRGIATSKQSNFKSARKNLICAAEMLLKLAQRSRGATKAQRLKRVNEIYVLANKQCNKSINLNKEYHN